MQNRISFVTSAAWVAFTHADLGDFEAAFEDLDQAARAATASGHPYPQAIAHTLAGLVHLRRGRLEEALPLLQQSVDACREKGIDVWRPIPIVAARASRASGSARSTRGSRCSRRA